MSDKVYEILTQRVIKMLENPEQANGLPTWQKDWSGVASPMNLMSGKQYRGINALLLMLAGLVGGFASNYWLTIKQANAKGGKVQKGAKGMPVIFYKMQDCDRVEQNTGEVLEPKQYPLVRYSLVFNLDQIEGVEKPAQIYNEGGGEQLTLAREVLRAYLRASAIGLAHGGGTACYLQAKDRILMPTGFSSEAAYSATLAHECVHSTGHEKRLNRFGSGGSNEQFSVEHRYPFEELVAELGALFYMSRQGLPYVLENHACYLKFWIEAMQAEPRMLAKAASRAEKALDFVLETVGKAELQDAQCQQHKNAKGIM